jgi:hypothetical protein
MYTHHTMDNSKRAHIEIYTINHISCGLYPILTTRPIVLPVCSEYWVLVSLYSEHIKQKISARRTA